MRRISGRSSFPFPSEARQSGGRQGGYALLVIMLMATLLLISLSAALPNIYVAGQREREEELIFRGNEYARAIGLFRRQFGRFPTSVEELIETNGMRFLRRAYVDPMSPKGRWRFIHAGANGALLDSRTQPRLPGGAGLQGMKPGEKPEEKKQDVPAQFDEPVEMRGAFIVGVASSSRRESIRIWNRRTRYDEWEFLGIEGGSSGILAPQAGQPERRGQPGLTIPTLPPLTEGPVPKG